MFQDERVVFGLLDLDGCFLDTPSAIESYGREVLGLRIKPGDYYKSEESVPKLWGFEPDCPKQLAAAREKWDDFFTTWVPNIPLMPGAEQTIQAFEVATQTLANVGVAFRNYIWTSRRPQYEGITRLWVGKHLPFITGIIHVIDWSRPDAAQTSKGNCLDRLPALPKEIVLSKDDEPAHAVPLANNLPHCEVGLFGRSRKNREAAVPPNVTKTTSHGEFAEIVMRVAREQERIAA
jgi:hypothetical protein